MQPYATAPKCSHASGDLDGRASVNDAMGYLQTLERSLLKVLHNPPRANEIRDRLQPVYEDMMLSERRFGSVSDAKLLLVAVKAQIDDRMWRHVSYPRIEALRKDVELHELELEQLLNISTGIFETFSVLLQKELGLHEHPEDAVEHILQRIMTDVSSNAYLMVESLSRTMYSLGDLARYREVLQQGAPTLAKKVTRSYYEKGVRLSPDSGKGYARLFLATEPEKEVTELLYWGARAVVANRPTNSSLGRLRNQWNSLQATGVLYSPKARESLSHAHRELCDTFFSGILELVGMFWLGSSTGFIDVNTLENKGVNIIVQLRETRDLKNVAETIGNLFITDPSAPVLRDFQRLLYVLMCCSLKDTDFVLAWQGLPPQQYRQYFGLELLLLSVNCILRSAMESARLEGGHTKYSDPLHSFVCWVVTNLIVSHSHIMQVIQDISKAMETELAIPKPLSQGQSILSTVELLVQFYNTSERHADLVKTLARGQSRAESQIVLIERDFEVPLLLTKGALPSLSMPVVLSGTQDGGGRIAWIWNQSGSEVGSAGRIHLDMQEHCLLQSSRLVRLFRDLEASDTLDCVTFDGVTGAPMYLDETARLERKARRMKEMEALLESRKHSVEGTCARTYQ